MQSTNLYYLLFLIISTLACQSQGAKEVGSEDVRKGANITLNQTPDYQNILSEKHKSDWTGSPDHWRWEDGRLIGETTEENSIAHSTFLVWNQEVEDFILNISFRISSRGNSGVYYRCEIGPEGYDKLLGYQADIDGANDYTGIVYENFLDRHHKILAKRGELVRISIVDSIQAFSLYPVDYSLKNLINDDTWNDYELIVKGNLIIQKLNGHIISMVEDQFPDRLEKGKLGFQLHKGPPMKVEFKDARFLDLGGG